LKLLFAEDEAPIRRIVERVMRREAIEVVFAEDGEDAWEKFQSNPESFDIIFTDVRMPNLDGLALVKRIRTHGHEVPCVLMTGHIDPVQWTYEPSVEIAAVLEKPFKLKRLLEITKQVLGESP
jgi:DNA-binding NtrC family response regulator